MRSRVASWVALAGLALLAATSPVASATSSASAPRLTASATSGPCRGTAVPARWSHVIWIVMENKRYSSIIGSASAPFENRLASECGLATEYHAITHPSLPNYLALTGGSTYGIRDDNGPASHRISAASIFSATAAAGLTWGSFEESMPGPCRANSSGSYAVKHNPAAYFTGLASSCPHFDVPMGTLTNGAFASELGSGRLPAFSFVTPNLCNDTHNCPVSTGDKWLSGWVSHIVASRLYADGRTALVITWDEDDESAANHVATIVVAPSVRPGTRSGVDFNHYSLLRTTEQMLGLPHLTGHAATAASMRSAFHL